MGERLRILVTDDEEGIRLGVARVLEKFVASFPDIDAESPTTSRLRRAARTRSSACATPRPTFCFSI